MNYLDFLRSAQAPMIRFGDRFFSHPEPVGGAGLSEMIGFPGLYSIVVSDVSWRPFPYRPLYFGESENLRSRATTSHENYLCWTRAGGTASLYRAFHYMTGSTRTQRQAAESQLIAFYNTPCNQRLSFSGLLGRL